MDAQSVQKGAVRKAHKEEGSEQPSDGPATKICPPGRACMGRPSLAVVRQSRYGAPQLVIPDSMVVTPASYVSLHDAPSGKDLRAQGDLQPEQEYIL